MAELLPDNLKLRRREETNTCKGVATKKLVRRMTNLIEWAQGFTTAIATLGDTPSDRTMYLQAYKTARRRCVAQMVQMKDPLIMGSDEMPLSMQRRVKEVRMALETGSLSQVTWGTALELKPQQQMQSRVEDFTIQTLRR